MLKRRHHVVLVSLFVALELHHVAQSQSIKGLDPTNKNSKLRDASRDLDSEARELGRRIDERRLDAISEPERKLSESAYFSYKAFVESKQVKTHVVRFQKGDFHF